MTGRERGARLHDHAPPRLATASRRRIAAILAAIALLAASALLAACGGEGEEEEEAVVWAVGDGDGSPEAAAVVKRISAAPFDRLLYLGDVYDDGSWSDYGEDFALTYGRLATDTAPTPGNHEWGRREEGYDPYWLNVRGRPIPDYYAFELAGWEILSLNSEIPYGPGSPQHRWLRAQLAEPGTCRIAYFHRARFSASTDHGDAPELEPLWDALRGRAAVVLAAHDHDMQRFKPIDGITQFVSGAGGHGLYQLAPDPRLAFGNDDEYGALRLELEPGVARHAFVAADDGEVLDRGTVTCDELR